MCKNRFHLCKCHCWGMEDLHSHPHLEWQIGERSGLWSTFCNRSYCCIVLGKLSTYFPHNYLQWSLKDIGNCSHWLHRCIFHYFDMDCLHTHLYLQKRVNFFGYMMKNLIKNRSVSYFNFFNLFKYWLPSLHTEPVYPAKHEHLNDWEPMIWEHVPLWHGFG